MTKHEHLDNDQITLIPTHQHGQHFADWAEHMTWHLDHPTHPSASDDLPALEP